MRRGKILPPFEMTVDRLDSRGLGLGTHDGRLVAISNVSPGETVEVIPTRRKKGVQHGRISRRVSPPPDAVLPRCPLFRTCGGCLLQDLSLDTQRRHREQTALAALGDLSGVTTHAIHGPEVAYGYRNKVELTFGPRKYLTTEELATAMSRNGRFVGFHPHGRFDPIVDVPRCDLVSEGMNAVIARVRRALADSAFEPWDVRAHQGFWRHLLLRESGTGERIVGIYTTEPPDPSARDELVALADDLPGVQGVAWYTSGRVADAVVGDLREILHGVVHLDEHVGDVVLRLSPTAFFQSSARGAEILYETIGEAAGRGERLLDLYCGVGAIGLYLARRFDAVVGVESNPVAVVNARENALRNGIANAVYFAAQMEALVEGEVPLDLSAADVVIVDPPRVGLHPRVATWLAGHPSKTLVYVACHPPSLGRDRAFLAEGGWRLAEVWPVDLFPQTPHVEVVGRFVREGG